jgi:ABC-type multidrug transport system fused ATPase/permease subunit
MVLFNKFLYLLNPKQRIRLIKLAVLLLISIFFEILGLGAIIPVMKILIQSDLVVEYPWIKHYLEQIGNPSRSVLVVYVTTLILILYFVKSIFLIFLSWRQASFSANLSATLSEKLFAGYLKHPYTFHLNRNSAQLLRNIQNETNLFIAVSISAITVSIEFTVLIGVAIALFYIEPAGALFVSLFLGFSSFVLVRLSKNKLKVWGSERQMHDGLATQHLMQGLGGVKEVKLLGLEGFFLNKFNFHNYKRALIYTKQITLQQVPRIYLEFLAIFALLGLVIFLNSRQSVSSDFVPVIGVFVAGAFRMIPSANRILSALQVIRFNKPVIDLFYTEFKNIEELTINSNEDFHFSFEANKVFKSLKVENLKFHYPNTDSPALDNISFEIFQGEMIGFVGSSGSGKTTMVDLLMGLLVPQEGKVSVNEDSIFNNIRDWQNLIGYVPQNIFLTDDTLRNNIAFGIPENEIEQSKVLNALKASRLSKFVDSLTDGLNVKVGERGVRLSGGQRQRIGIARALYHNPSVLVLDEATSSLDSETEKEVMDSVKQLKGNKTIIVIAHRISTILSCNKIFVLDKGRLVNVGKPEDLFPLEFEAMINIEKYVK